jgi:hypothetical protein
VSQQELVAELPGAPADLIEVRPYEPEDKPYVLDSWLHSDLAKRAKGRRLSHAQRHEWFCAHRPYYTAFLDRRPERVWVACDRDAPTSIMGWLVLPMDGTPIVHVRGLFASYQTIIAGALERAARAQHQQED